MNWVLAGCQFHLRSKVRLLQQASGVLLSKLVNGCDCFLCWHLRNQGILLHAVPSLLPPLC